MGLFVLGGCVSFGLGDMSGIFGSDGSFVSNGGGFGFNGFGGMIMIVFIMFIGDIVYKSGGVVMVMGDVISSLGLIVGGSSLLGVLVLGNVVDNVGNMVLVFGMGV